MMAPSSHPVPPFFEPGPLSPALPLLTSQTELPYDVFSQTNLAVHEVFSPSILRVVTPPKAALDASPSKSNSSGSSDSSSESDLTDLTDSSSSDSSSSSSDSSASDTDADSGKIGQPVGQPGRPGRGGYNVKDAVGWTTDNFDRLKVCSLLMLAVLSLILIQRNVSIN
jgi:hypothetical protein